MVNAALRQKLAETDLHPVDRDTILRIFPILSDERKIAILDSWDEIAQKIRANRERIETEKRILLLRTLDDLESDLDRALEGATPDG